MEWDAENVLVKLKTDDNRIKEPDIAGFLSVMSKKLCEFKKNCVSVGAQTGIVFQVCYTFNYLKETGVAAWKQKNQSWFFGGHRHLP